MRAKAAREYEKEHGVANGDTPALSGWTPGGLRAYRLENAAWVGQTMRDLLRQHPEYRSLNLVREGEALGAKDDARSCGRATSSRLAVSARR